MLTALIGPAGALVGGAASGTAGCRRCVAASMKQGDLLLDVQGLRAKVEDTDILNGMNLQVKRGEVHAIMGPNGSGKSTFSKVLVGHPSYEVTAGSAQYGGGTPDEGAVDLRDLLELETEERAQQGVFLAFQYPVEIPGVSNNDFLRLAVNKRRAALGEEEYDPIEFFGVLSEKMATVCVDLYALDTRAGPARIVQPRSRGLLLSHGTHWRRVRGLGVPYVPRTVAAQATVGMSADFLSRDVNGGFSGGEKKRNEILQMSLRARA